MSHTSRPTFPLSHRTLRGALAPTFFCIAVLGSAHAAHAATFVVNTTSDAAGGTCTTANCTLREAIAAANAAPGADTITFSSLFDVADKTITLGAGELTISSDLTIIGPARGVTIDAHGASRVLNVASGTVNLEGLTITGVSLATTEFVSTTPGGGIYNAGTLNMMRCQVSGNSLTALSVLGITPGGGLYNVGTLNMTRCQVSGNTANGNPPVSSFAGNSAQGGGIFNNGTLTMTQCAIIGNTVNKEGQGGGIYNAATGTAVIDNCTVGNNQATRPAKQFETVVLEGGGIYSLGTLKLNSSTVSGNVALSGGGVRTIGDTRLSNSIIAGNTNDEIAGGVTSLGYNLIGNFPDPNVFDQPSDQINLTGSDVGLGALGNNGGPTPTFALLPFSPAINAANLNLQSGTDQRGLPRTISGRADIGAFEFQNQAPVASDHSKTLNQDMTLVLTAADFATAPFYTDPENDPLTRIQITQLPDSQSGVLKLGDNLVPLDTIIPAASLNNLNFAPALGFEGSASFQYKVADSGTYSGTAATLGLQVLATSNNAPTISDIANQITNQNTPLGPLAFTVADNDTLLSSLSVNATSSNTTLVPNSALALGGSGANRTLTIAPASGQSGSTIITVTVSDGSAQSSDTFVLQVLAPNAPPSRVNQAPVAAPQLVSVQRDTSLFLILTGSDVDTPEANLTYRVASLPAHGSLSGAAPNLNYTPDTGFSGADSFTFVINDGALDSAPSTISITVRGDNTPPTTPPNVVPPIAVDDSYTLVYGSASQAQAPDVTLMTTGVFKIDASGLLGNDRDSQNRPLSARLDSYPKHGRIQVRNDGSFFYLPNSGFAGVDEFAYTLSNGQSTALGKVTLKVIDHIAPELRFDSPRDGAVVNSVSEIKGRARDRQSGLKTLTLVWQRFDGKFWNGGAWTANLTELPLKVNGTNWVYEGVMPAPGSDGASDLLNGKYQLRVTATDNSGNVSRLINRVTIGSSAPNAG